jgi:hypothetical protein
MHGLLLAALEVLTVLCICEYRPVVEGVPPSTRFRHTTALIEPSPGTKLEELVTEALPPRDEFGAGQLLFCFGGYNTTGEEFGLDSTYVRPCNPALMPGGV